MGCYSDVVTIYGLCGIAQPTLKSAKTQVPYAPGQGPTNNSAVISGSQADTAEQIYGVMKLNPVFAVFCPVRVIDTAGFNTGVSMMRYYGYISSLGVQYTHWTQRMIPTRCVVSIGMSLLMTDKNLVEP
jgi:hypothetical protein